MHQVVIGDLKTVMGALEKAGLMAGLEESALAEADFPAAYYMRDVKFLVPKIIEALAGKIPISGPDSHGLPREQMLAEKRANSVEFREALITVAESVLEVFPPTIPPEKDVLKVEESYPKEFYTRETEFMIKNVVEALSDYRPLTGVAALELPREQMLAEERGNNPAFETALHVVVSTLVKLFPREQPPQ